MTTDEKKTPLFNEENPVMLKLLSSAVTARVSEQLRNAADRVKSGPANRQVVADELAGLIEDLGHVAKIDAKIDELKEAEKKASAAAWKAENDDAPKPKGKRDDGF